MTQCPKCGCCQIHGPYYQVTKYGERLEYRCSGCGYSSSTPTLDSKKRTEYPDAK
jgi:hypothetical protein